MAQPLTTQFSLRARPGDGSPPLDWELLAATLRTELVDVGADRVEPAAAAPAPEGTRGLVGDVIGTLDLVITAKQAVDVLTGLVRGIRRWHERHRGDPDRGGLHVEIAGIELTGDESVGQIVERLTSLAAFASDRAGTRRALVIANVAYDDAALRGLRAPADDARALDRVLSDPRIGGFDVDVCLDETEPVVRRRIAGFFADREPGDLLLLHYSGHGLKDARGRLYLAARDTELRRLSATAVPAAFVNDQMTDSTSRRIVLVLDCCYSGAFARGGPVRADRSVHVAEEFGGEGRVVLTASSATEYAFEGGELAEAEGLPSVFTSALVRGLESGAADLDADGDITVDELYDYAYREVRRAQPAQAPMKWNLGVEGALVVARSVRGGELPSELADDIRSGRIGLRMEAVEELHGLLAGKPGLRDAARRALEALRDKDDSIRVRSAAAAALGLPAPAPAPVVPEEPAPVREEPPPAPPAPAGNGEDRTARVRRRTLIGAGLAVLAAVGIPVAIVETRGADKEPETPSVDPVTAVALSPDGATLATASYLSEVIGLWDGPTGHAIRPLTLPPATAGDDRLRNARALAYSPDGTALLIGCDDGTIRRYIVATQTVAPSLTGQSRAIDEIAVSPDGRLIASGGEDKTAVLLAAATGQTLAIITAHTDAVRGVAFSPDGKILATASADGTIGLWSTAGGAPIRTLTLETVDYFTTVAFTPDGRQLFAIGSGDVHRWDLSTDVHQSIRLPRNDSVTALAISPDGSTIAAGTYDGPIALIDSQTREVTATLEGHTQQIGALQFGHSGTVLASGSFDGTGRMWDLATGKTRYTVSGTVPTPSPSS